MNCSGVLSGLLNQTATTSLKLPKTGDLVLLANTPSRKNCLAVSNKAGAIEEYNCSAITRDTLGKTTQDGWA